MTTAVTWVLDELARNTRKGKSSKYNFQDDGHHSSGPAVHVRLVPGRLIIDLKNCRKSPIKGKNGENRHGNTHFSIIFVVNRNWSNIFVVSLTKDKDLAVLDLFFSLKEECTLSNHNEEVTSGNLFPPRF